MDAPLSTAWSAPRATTGLDAQIDLPGSKSLTNRELVLAALADGPSRLLRPLHSRDAQLMVEGLRSLGSGIEPVAGDGAYGSDLIITPGVSDGSISIDVGLAGTAMRFLPFVAALTPATVHFDGDPHARMRPMRETIESLRALGAVVDDGGRAALPFSVQGSGGLEGGALTIDASRSSQFVSALLLAAPRFEHGLT
ncbi:MAG TPA: 3-phosphoshikimate 1-carboxyvinyltransferase, partial [Candidatus Agrococcus pullicola]|nr:3-phosphoshikimate 1-carboxyvinyltransferase [Candidatus Agrococcus pullicola]